MTKRKKRRNRQDTVLAVTVDQSGFVQEVHRVPVGERQEPDRFVTCAKCGKKVHRSDVRQHHENVHSDTRRANAGFFSQPQQRRMISCPRCGVAVSRKKLKKHLNKMHATDAAGPPLTKKAGRPTGAKGGALVSCPSCGRLLKPGSMARHVAQLHPKSEKRQVIQVTATRRKRQSLTACPRCGAGVTQKNMRRHLRKVHGVERESQNSLARHSRPSTNVSEKVLVICPICEVSVREDRLEKHKRKVHGEMARKASESDAASRMRPRRAPSRQPRSRRRGGSSPGRLGSEERMKLEALSQSLDEPRDGSKYWGHMRREHGRFGSHPLFDNYGDESEP